jgi:hypothetical protein
LIDVSAPRGIAALGSTTQPPTEDRYPPATQITNCIAVLPALRKIVEELRPWLGILKSAWRNSTAE